MGSSKEYQLISQYCHEPGGLPIKYEELLKVAENLSALANSSNESQTNITWSLNKVLGQEEAETVVLRGLLLIEKILEDGSVSINSLYSVRKRLENLKSTDSKQISVKSAKIFAIIEHLKCSKAA
jgi:uncharacterized protein (UPF0147 family)